MSHPPRPIGEIFLDLGRITSADVEHALAFQREHGGRFGEALVALGILTADEVRWALADQHDIPFAVLRADQIDRSVAMQVPAAWARRHQVLPVLRDAGTVTVAVADPTSIRHFAEIRRLTGASKVEAALCSGEHLVALLDAVFAHTPEPEASLLPWLEAALPGATRLGVSARSGRVSAWTERDGERTRSPLEDGWLDALHDAVVPFARPLACAPESWDAVAVIGAGVWTVRCHWVASGAGTFEWSAEVRHGVMPDPRRVVVDEALRAAAAARAGRLGVVGVSATEGLETALALALPRLPELLFGDGARVIHVASRDALTLPGVLARRVDADADLAEVVASLGVFAPDAVTVDLAAGPAAGAALYERPGSAPVFLHGAHGSPGGISARLVLDGDMPVWTLD